MMNEFRRARRRAMAWEMKAEAMGANTRLAMRKADGTIHVRFRKSIEMQATPHPMMNQTKHLPVTLSDSGDLRDVPGHQSRGE